MYWKSGLQIVSLAMAAVLPVAEVRHGTAESCDL